MCYDGLMLLPEGPRTLWQCPEGPWTFCECPARLAATRLVMSGQVATCRDLSGLVGTCRNLSGLVWSPVGLRAGPGVPIPKDFQAWYHQAASFMPAGRFLQAGGTEGRFSRSGTLDR